MTLRSSFLLILSLSCTAILCAQVPSSNAPIQRECIQIGNLIKSKGFSYPWWSNTQVPNGGEVCPGGEKSVKCCPGLNSEGLQKEMLDNFEQKWVGPKLGLAAEVFKDRKSRFDVTFKSLLTRAHASFHAMFERTYGMLYIQHAHVFHALFTTLENYYENGREALEAKLNEFFSILTRKMFQVLNSQYEFDETYLSCASIVISSKQENDMHRQIVSSLRRSFVATRALAQGLVEAEKVISNMQKLHLNNDECGAGLSSMLHCPICSEQRAFKPCPHLCKAVTSKCLTPMGALNKPWNDFSSSLEGIIDRLLGPYNVEAVVEPIHIKISEAIMNFQESGTELSQAVFAKCGKPMLKSRGFRKRETSIANINPLPILAGNKTFDKSKRAPAPRISKAKESRGKSGGSKIRGGGGRRREEESEDGVQPSKSLEKLLRETKNKVKKGKTLWSTFYQKVCNAIGKDYSSRQCWNGTVSVKAFKNYKTLQEEGEDESKAFTPRTTPVPLVAEQILILQLITDKLRSAYNGLDVTWVVPEGDDEELEIGSGDGSGSGDSPDDLEDDDDDDPSGVIRKPSKTPVKPKETHFQPPITSSTARPTYIRRPLPTGTPPPIFKPIPVQPERENSISFSPGFNPNLNNNRGGFDFGPFVPPSTSTPAPPPTQPPWTPPPTTTTTRPPWTPPPTQPPWIPPPTQPPWIPPPTQPPWTPRPRYTTPPIFYTQPTTVRTTSTTTMTTRRPTLPPRRPNDVVKVTKTSNLTEAGKALSVFKLFAPVIGSMIGKLFSFSN